MAKNSTPKNGNGAGQAGIGAWFNRFMGNRQAPASDSRDLDAQTQKDLYRVIWFLIWGLSFGVFGILFHEGSHAGVALLWSLACMLTGGLVGFLFGIPRELQRG